MAYYNAEEHAADLETLEAARKRTEHEERVAAIRDELTADNLPRWRREALHAALRTAYRAAGYSDCRISPSGVLLRKCSE